MTDDSSGDAAVRRLLMTILKLSFKSLEEYVKLYCMLKLKLITNKNVQFKLEKL